MPHRFDSITHHIAHGSEGILLSLCAIYQGAFAFISETDWDRMTGKHGALFVLAVGVLVLWNASRMRDKKEDARRKTEDEARERRHQELVTTNRDNADSLKALTVDAIKANMRATVAIETMDRNIQMLTIETKDSRVEQREVARLLASSPCIATGQPRGQQSEKQ